MAFNFSPFQDQLSKALEHIQHELGLLRTGKASTQLLDSVMVEAYGGKMKLNEVANVSAPDANLLTVSPWDKSLLSAIEKAISVSGINLNPVVSGDMIRIVVPPLTQERRQEMVKILSQKIESGKVMLRSVRTDTKKDIEKQKGQPGISEDQIKADEEHLEKLIKEALETLDQMNAAKEKELMTI